MKITAETNVLISGLLTPFTSAGEIVRLITLGSLKLYYDVRLLHEYSEVLHRKKFGFINNKISAFLGQIQKKGQQIVASPLAENLPDLYTEPFLAVAVSANAPYLVTNNAKPYPNKKYHNTQIVSPAEFIEAYRKTL